MALANALKIASILWCSSDLSFRNDEKLHAIKIRAQMRGFELPEEVGHLLLKKYSSSMSELYRALELLDEASIAEKKKITLPLAKQVL